MLDGSQRSPTGRGRLGVVLHFTMGNAIGSPTVKCFRFVCENLTFPFGKHIVGKLDSCAFGDIFGFNINVGVDEKFAKKSNTYSAKSRMLAPSFLPVLR